MEERNMIRWIFIILALFLFLKLIKLPLKLLFKALLSTAAGIILLVIINYIGAAVGIVIGINIINALIVAVLGLPGIALLLLLQII